MRALELTRNQVFRNGDALCGLVGEVNLMNCHFRNEEVAEVPYVSVYPRYIRSASSAEFALSKFHIGTNNYGQEITSETEKG